jgi:hypothetical protein
MAADDLLNVRRRVLVQFLIVSKDDHGDIDGTEHGKLMRLLEQAAFALEEGHAAVTIVANCIAGVSIVAGRGMSSKQAENDDMV